MSRDNSSSEGDLSDFQADKSERLGSLSRRENLPENGPLAPEAIISIPRSSVLLVKSGWSFFLTRGIELGTDFYMMSLLNKIGPNSGPAGSLIFSSTIILRSVNATYLMLAPYVIKALINSNEKNQVGAVMFHNLLIATGLSVLFIPPVLLSHSIFLAMNQPVEAADIASQFLLWYLPGLPANLFYVSNQQCCIGLEYTTTVLLITIPVKLLTVFLGRGWMFGEFGMTKYNESGFAAANGVAGLVGFAGYLAFYALNKDFRPYNIFLPRLRESGPILKKLIVDGASIFAYSAIELGSVFMVTILLGSTGNANLAAVQPALQYGFILANLIFAFGQTSGIQIKQKLEEAKENEIHFKSARRLGYVAFSMAELLPLALLITYGFGRRQLVNVFLDKASASVPSIVNAAEIFLLTNLLGQLADTSRNIMGGALRAYGDTAFPMAVNLTTTLLINVPVAITATLAFEADPTLTLVARNSAILVGGMVLLNKYRMRSNQFDANPPESLWSRTKGCVNSFISLFTSCTRSRKRDRSVNTDESPLVTTQTL